MLTTHLMGLHGFPSLHKIFFSTGVTVVRGTPITAVARATNKPSVMKSFIPLTGRLIPFKPSWTDLNPWLENWEDMNRNLINYLPQVITIGSKD